MSNVLVNSDFNTSMVGWTDDGLAWDSGWVKTISTAFDVYSLWQDVELVSTADMTVATMGADIKWLCTENLKVKFRLKLRRPDGVTWETPKTSLSYGDSGEIQDWASEDVLSMLQTGGDGTWRIAFSIELEYGAVQGSYGWFDDCTLDITLAYSDTSTETMAMTDAYGDDVAVGDVAAETLALTDSGSDVADISDIGVDTVLVTDDVADLAIVALELDYSFYFGSFDGKLYRENTGYKSDNGTAIDAYWISKQSDFADEYLELCLGKFKTIYGVILEYVDVKANSSITISISTDGGENWTTRAKGLGTGDETTKMKVFDFHLTGNHFQFKIESDSDTDDFQWTGIRVLFKPKGVYFEV